MAPEIFSEEIKPRQFQPAPRKMVFVFRQTRNPAKEVFEKLSLKLKGQELPGIEFAEQYLSHLYGRNRRAGTLEHNNISIRFFLEFLKAKGIACIEAVSRKDLAAFIEHEQDGGMKPVSVRGRPGSVKAFLRYLVSVNRLKALFFENKIHPQIPDSRALAPEVRQIMQAVCSYYRLDESELVKSRRGWFNEPRAVAIHLVRTMRKDSFADIALGFGLRGYSSVGAVLDLMRKRLATDPELHVRCQRIMKTISIGRTETSPHHQPTGITDGKASY
jgi:hypothetical protein